MFKLYNYMETIVDIKLTELLDCYTDICKCEKCILDIKAIALNKLPTHYIVTDEGFLFMKVKTELNLQENIDIASAVTAAIEIVSKNTKHQ